MTKRKEPDHLLDKGQVLTLTMKDYRIPSLNVVLGSNRWAKVKAKKECGQSILSALEAVGSGYSTQTTSTARMSSINSAMLALSQRILQKSSRSTSRKKRSRATNKRKR